MSQDKIESRRAFMKKLGKLAGAAAVAAAFMATGSNVANAKPSVENPTVICHDCTWSCGQNCKSSCMGTCTWSCGQKQM